MTSKRFSYGRQHIVTNFLFNLCYRVLTWCDIHVSAEAMWLSKGNCVLRVEDWASPMKVG